MKKMLAVAVGLALFLAGVISCFAADTRGAVIIRKPPPQKRMHLKGEAPPLPPPTIQPPPLPVILGEKGGRQVSAWVSDENMLVLEMQKPFRVSCSQACGRIVRESDFYSIGIGGFLKNRSPFRVKIRAHYQEGISTQSLYPESWNWKNYFYDKEFYLNAGEETYSIVNLTGRSEFGVSLPTVEPGSESIDGFVRMNVWPVNEKNEIIGNPKTYVVTVLNPQKDSYLIPVSTVLDYTTGRKRWHLSCPCETQEPECRAQKALVRGRDTCTDLPR